MACLDPDPSVELELVGGALTARVHPSSDPGNALTVVADGVYAAGGFATAVRRASSNQSFTGPQAGLAVAWDTEDFDTGNGWDSANPSRITLAKSGMYSVSCWVFWTVGAVVAGTEGVKIRVNGTTDLSDVATVTTAQIMTPRGGSRGMWFDMNWQAAFTTTTNRGYNLSGRFRANAGDYIEAVLVSPGTGACNISGSTGATGGASGLITTFLHPLPSF